MTHFRTLSYSSYFSRSKCLLVLPLLCLSLLTSCATTTANGDLSQAQLESMVKEADAEISNGQREKAITLLNQAAKEYPTSAVPWLKMANIWFEASNYPSTILAANEVLQRDAANQEAKSLLVVAGLRVAANSVSGLRAGSGVNSNVRIEAENLTNSLRTVVGEKVLVPAPNTESRPASHPVRRKAKSRAAAAPVAPPASAHTSADAGAADPFKSLK